MHVNTLSDYLPNLASLNNLNVNAHSLIEKKRKYGLTDGWEDADSMVCFALKLSFYSYHSTVLVKTTLTTSSYQSKQVYNGSFDSSHMGNRIEELFKLQGS